VTGRPRGKRREVILEAAAELFSERGFPATGVDDIGAATGISGPAVYRHFDAKSEVLGEIVQRALVQVLDGVDRVRAATDDPTLVLTGLAENMVRTVLADRAAWAVVVQERRHLDPATARAFSRAHRLHVEEWVQALAELRPDLSDGQQRTIVHGVLGLAAPYATRYDPGLDDDRVVGLLVDASLRVLRTAR
jgi:AcrR family transcriptional regulator